MHRAKLIAFFILHIICTNVSAQGKEYNIAAIRVEGSNTTDKTVVIALSGLSVGQTIHIPGQEAASAIKLLWKQGLFSSIDIIAERYQGKKIGRASCRERVYAPV